jgi:hypothetical protein
MTGLTDFITDAAWEDVFTIWFVLVDEAYLALEQHFGAWRQRGPAPAFHDSEVITVALITDTFFHGHEALSLSFLRQYHPSLFPALPSNGQLNTRRRLVGPLMEQIRRYLTHQWGLIDPEDTCRLGDSAPIPVCTYTRAKQNATLQGDEYFGVMPSRKAKLFGVRLQVTATTDQVVDEWWLVPASVHDSKAGMGEGVQEQVLLLDGAYHDPLLATVQKARRSVDSWAVPRQDSRTPWPAAFRAWVTRIRRRIETVFSVLTTVFNIEQLGSRSLDGLFARVATRMLAYTLCFVTQAMLVQLSGETPN